MHTKILMSLSALFMAVVGLAASFMPKEILIYAGAWDEGFEVFLMQVLGALYLGFAMLNWIARASLIGGTYSRPVVMGNFTHFVVVAVTLIKALLAGFHSTEVVLGVAAYTLFASWFGAVLFLPPQKNK